MTKFGCDATAGGQSSNLTRACEGFKLAYLEVLYFDIGSARSDLDNCSILISP